MNYFCPPTMHNFCRPETERSVLSKYKTKLLDIDIFTLMSSKANRSNISRRREGAEGRKGKTARGRLRPIAPHAHTLTCCHLVNSPGGSQKSKNNDSERNLELLLFGGAVTSTTPAPEPEVDEVTYLSP
jgi:hypothetical protein